MVTTAIIKVDRALISGLTPSRTAEKILIGKVVAEGPAVKLAITRSSRESVKANSQPEITAGAIRTAHHRCVSGNGRAPDASKQKAAAAASRHDASCGAASASRASKKACEAFIAGVKSRWCCVRCCRSTSLLRWPNRSQRSWM